jgi:tyrosine-protein kinase Etk/Wzc
MKPIVTNNRRNDEDKEENVAQQALSKYLPYWPLFILAVLIALAAAYVYLRYATPIYEATATMIIKDEKRGTQDSKLVEDLDHIAAKKVVENEIEVLQSRAIMEAVVKRLSLYVFLTQKGKVKEADAYVVSPITVEARNPDSVVATEKIYFAYDKATQTVTLNGKEKYPLNTFVPTAWGTLRFLPNKNFSPSLESGKELYFTLEDPRVVANGMIRGLKVASSRQSAIIDISYRDAMPQRAVNILNELIKVYEETSIRDKNTLATSTLAFLDERLDILGKDLDSIEKKIQSYKSGTNAVNVGSQGELYLQNVASNDQRLGEVNNQLAMLGQVEKSVSSRTNSDAISPSAVSDPTLSGLMNKLYTSQLEYNNMKQTMGENNPLLLAKAEEINKIRPSILENIQTQKAALGASRQSLAATNGGYNAILRTVPQKERQILEISREHATKSQSYAYLLQKKQETEMGLASVTLDNKVVDKAMAGNFPVSPNKKLIYMMAVVAALGLCVGVITLKDAFTGKIKYRTEIEKMTEIPIIGEIAFDKSKTPLVIEKGTRSFVAEEFRKLRISLSFLGVDSAHKKILFTSSISGEGKSFIAANLAVSISLTGKKVVLVDMDLNNPSLSRILNVNQEYGVTELLTGEKSVNEVTKRLEGHENLYFISPGSLPENPSELLANGKVNAIIDYLDNNFDMVIVDTSPAVLVTDAFILSGLCDATLYVIRHDYTPKMLVKRIDENNQINPLHNPAIVFNGVKSRGIIKNNYGYGYDYVYGNKERGSKNKKVS